jgi:type II secretory pathway component PulJ
MSGREDGSVLLEALIAFAITASVVIMSLGGLAQGAARLKISEERLRALAEARTILAELSAAHSLTSSTRSGVTSGGLPWTVTITEEQMDMTRFSVRPFRISLQVGLRVGHTNAMRMETYVISRHEDK